MTVQNQTPDIAADGVVSIREGIGTLARPRGGHQAVNRTTLTCTWVTADDGALVMQWTQPTSEREHAEMTKVAA
jgi:hypothetical protein